MEEYESLRLEHVALVMDAEKNEDMDAVSIMTLHSAKGLEFETVFRPAGRKGVSHQRALDEGAAPGWRRNAASPASADAPSEPAPLVHLQPPHPRTVAVDHSLALPRRIAREPCRGDGDRQFLWRLRRRRLRRQLWRTPQPLRRLALRHCRQGRQRLVLQHLRNARLGARSEAPHRGDRPQLGLALRPRRRAMARRGRSGYGAARLGEGGSSRASWSPSGSDTPSFQCQHRPST